MFETCWQTTKMGPNNVDVQIKKIDVHQKSRENWETNSKIEEHPSKTTYPTLTHTSFQVPAGLGCYLGSSFSSQHFKARILHEMGVVGWVTYLEKADLVKEISNDPFFGKKNYQPDYNLLFWNSMSPGRKKRDHKWFSSRSPLYL